MEKPMNRIYTILGIGCNHISRSSNQRTWQAPLNRLLSAAREFNSKGSDEVMKPPRFTPDQLLLLLVLGLSITGLAVWRYYAI